MSDKNKFNLTKQDTNYYSATNKPSLIDLGTYSYLRIKGKGNTLDNEFNNKVNGLFFFYKMLQQVCKKEDISLTIPKLEIVRWVEGDSFQEQVADSQWFWILLVRKYDFLNEDIIEETRDFCLRKKNFEMANQITTEKMHIGQCVQIMHHGKIGSEIYSKKELNKYISVNGYEENGFYHEIHLSYPRKVIPENMKSILRQPIKK